MPQPALTWFHTLTDSVAALGLAAREYRAAGMAAEVAAWQVEPVRLAPVDGMVGVPDQYLMSPHEDALTKLGDLHFELADKTKRLYENTARAYAYGTAEALESVLAGGQPQYVPLARDRGLYALPAHPLPDFADALGEWDGHARLDSLRERVSTLAHARAAVNAYAFYEDLADFEPPEIKAAIQLAAGLADAACAYGEQAESALLYVLISSTAAVKQEGEEG